MDKEYTCKAGVIKSETLTECPNEFLTPKGFNGPFVGKIPVVLAEPLYRSMWSRLFNWKSRP